MYVCLCLALTDRDVADAVGGGAHTFRAVAARCGAGTVCGGCRPAIAALVRREGKDAAAEIASVIQMRGQGEHADSLETELGLIVSIGEANHLAQQIHD